jgi:hypothetical protein
VIVLVVPTSLGHEAYNLRPKKYREVVGSRDKAAPLQALGQSARFF